MAIIETRTNPEFVLDLKGKSIASRLASIEIFTYIS